MTVRTGTKKCPICGKFFQRLKSHMKHKHLAQQVSENIMELAKPFPPSEFKNTQTRLNQQLEESLKVENHKKSFEAVIKKLQERREHLMDQVTDIDMALEILNREAM